MAVGYRYRLSLLVVALGDVRDKKKVGQLLVGSRWIKDEENSLTSEVNRNLHHTVKTTCREMLKGQCHEIFLHIVYMIISPSNPINYVQLFKV
jgi:hypothetical protein